MKMVAVLLVVILAVSTFIAPSFAAGKKSFKQASKDAARASVNYPSYLVSESATVVGDAGKGFVNAIGGMVRYTGETLTGDVKKAPKIVTTPVEDTAYTVKDATVGTVEAPVKAGRRTAERM